MTDGRLVGQLSEHYKRQMRSHVTAQVRTAEKVRKAIGDDGTINAGALRTTLVLSETWQKAGALAVGTDIAGARRMTQNATLRSLFASVDSAPVGSEATFALAVDGVVKGTVTITAGATDGTSNISVSVTAGQVLTINATEVGITTPAQDLTLALTYSPAT